jgi:beta-N-acetylhexosaminidase
MPGRVRRGLAVAPLALSLCAGPTGCTAAGPASVAGPQSAGSATTPSTGWATPSASTRPSASGPAPATILATCVAGRLAGLTVADRVGQLLVVGVPATAPDQGASLVRAVRAGGVFLHGRSTQPLDVVATGIGRLQTAAAAAGLLGLQVTVDQEGGQVQTFAGPGFSIIPSAVVQGGWTASGLRDTTAVWATALRRAGVTWNLAPVADTVAPGVTATNPPIGGYAREFGTTPAAVGDAVTTVVRASSASGLLTTVKHFPGLGRVTTNPDTSTSATDPVATADDPYLQPFVRGIAAGSSAVMISSARYPKLDAAHLAVFSSAVVHDLLRGTLGYDGLIVSDDLGQAASVQSVPAGQRAVQFVTAGGDVVLTVRGVEAAPMYLALLAAVKASSTFRARVDESVARALALKVRAGLVPCAGFVPEGGPRSG